MANFPAKRQDVLDLPPGNDDNFVSTQIRKNQDGLSMQARTFLVALAGLLTAASAVAGETAHPQKVNAMLCDTEAQAIAYASALSSGQSEPLAANIVNKSAGTEVCGRFIGYAVVEVEKTKNEAGALYMLAGLRFAEDGRLAWTASWVTPFDGLSVARGI